MSVCITRHRILGLEAIFQETSKYAKAEIGKNRIKHRTLYWYLLGDEKTDLIREGSHVDCLISVRSFNVTGN